MSFYSTLGLSLLEHPIQGLHPIYHESSDLPTGPQLVRTSDNSCILSGGLLRGKPSSQILKFSYGKLELIGSMFHPKMYHAQVLINNTLYTIGGSSDSTSPTPIFESYDLVTNSRNLLNPLPESRKMHSASACNSRIFVIGGMNDSSSPKQTILYYTIATQTWSKLKLSHSTAQFSNYSIDLSFRNSTAVSIDDRSILILGGYFEGMKYNYDFYTLDTYKFEMHKMKFVCDYNVFTGGYLLKDNILFIADTSGGRHLIHISHLLQEILCEYGKEHWKRRKNLIWIYKLCKQYHNKTFDRMPFGVFQNTVRYL
jgi:hypothetical protein